METPKLGQLIECEVHRDAIHIAVAPVTAGEKLRPGEDIGVDGSTAKADIVPLVGIVDPFLKKAVFPGQRFYVFLYPGTITSLRHEWVHPAFGGGPCPPPEMDANAARTIIEKFGHATGLSYERVMEAAKDYLESSEYIHNGENESYKDADWDSMWKAYEFLTGRKIDDGEKGWFFSCSC